MLPSVSLPDRKNRAIVFRDNSATVTHGVGDSTDPPHKTLNTPISTAGLPGLLPSSTPVTARAFSPDVLGCSAEVTHGSSPTHKVDDVSASRACLADATVRPASGGASTASGAGLRTKNSILTRRSQDSFVTGNDCPSLVSQGLSSDTSVPRTAYQMQDTLATTASVPVASSRDSDSTLLPAFTGANSGVTPALTTRTAEHAITTSLPARVAEHDVRAEQAIANRLQEGLTAQSAENAPDTGADICPPLSSAAQMEPADDAMGDEDVDKFLDFPVDDLHLATDCDANFEELAFESVAVPMKKRMVTERIGDDLLPAEPLIPLPIPERAEDEDNGDVEGRELSEDDVGLLSDGDEDIRAEMRCYGEECFKPLLRSVNSLEVQRSGVLGSTDMYMRFDEKKINSAAAPVKKKAAGDASTMFKTLQWVRHHAETQEGVPLTAECVKKIALQIIWAGSGRESMTCSDKSNRRFVHKWKKEKVEPYAGIDIGNYVYRHDGQKCRPKPGRIEDSGVDVSKWPISGKEDAASDSGSARSGDFVVCKPEKYAEQDGVKAADNNGGPGSDPAGDSGKPDDVKNEPGSGGSDPHRNSDKVRGGDSEPGGAHDDCGTVEREKDKPCSGSGDPSGDSGALNGDADKLADGGKRESVDAPVHGDDLMDGIFQGPKKRRKEEVSQAPPPAVSSDEDSVLVMCPEGWMQAKKLRKRKKKKRSRPTYPPPYPSAPYPPYPPPPYGYSAAPPFGFPGPQGAPHPFGFPPMVGGLPPGNPPILGYPGGAPMMHPGGMRPPMIPGASWPHPTKPKKKRKSKKAGGACNLEEDNCVSDSD